MLPKKSTQAWPHLVALPLPFHLAASLHDPFPHPMWPNYPPALHHLLPLLLCTSLQHPSPAAAFPLFSLLLQLSTEPLQPSLPWTREWHPPQSQPQDTLPMKACFRLFMLDFRLAVQLALVLHMHIAWVSEVLEQS